MKKRVNKKFLFAFIKSSLCRNKINSLIEVGARFRFNFERWDLINIPFPPRNPSRNRPHSGHLHRADRRADHRADHPQKTIQLLPRPVVRVFEEGGK